MSKFCIYGLLIFPTHAHLPQNVPKTEKSAKIKKCKNKKMQKPQCRILNGILHSW
jgi:hypothetical protein